MKYGEALRQRSIPAWSHYNVDYDDIKHLIKERTTPGKGKHVAIPGRGDERLAEFEHELFTVFVEQHHRIDLFVRSKAGEIQRRLEHASKQTQQLAKQYATSGADVRLSMGFLQRVNKVETEINKAGDEIKSLTRFIAAQRTAFRKLLKKFKKWTGSSSLEDRFHDDISENPKSFTNLDLEPLLDKFAAARVSIKSVYEKTSPAGTGPSISDDDDAQSSSTSAVQQLRKAVHSSSRVSFDAAMKTVPLGQSGVYASYFAHLDNIGELEVLLLQHLQSYAQRRRKSSATVSMSSSPRTRFSRPGDADLLADYHAASVDCLERFVTEQGSLTINDRENLPGSTPQKAFATLHWNDDEDALSCVRHQTGSVETTSLKRKHLPGLLSRSARITNKSSESPLASDREGLDHLRQQLNGDAKLETIYTLASNRSRFVGLENDASNILLATLESNISIRASYESSSKSDFPFALLVVRQEGSSRSSLLSVLDHSHLVERVRGFSLEYHGVWSTHPALNVAAPFWLPLLSTDIRKPHPLPAARSGLGERGSLSRSMTSAGSTQDATGSNTAVETSNDVSLQDSSPPRRHIRKERKHANFELPSQPQARYWSEYDHPEDGDDANDPFVIYIDPNEKSAFDHFFDKIGSVFSFRSQHREKEEDPLLQSPTSPKDDETSSDEGIPSSAPSRSFGTFPRFSVSQSTPAPSSAIDSARQGQARFFSHFALTCFSAANIILLVAFVLSLTSKHKYVGTVDVSIIFAIVCSLTFAVAGFISVLHQGTHRAYLSGIAWAISVIILLIDCVAAGCLLVWMFG